MDSKRRGKEAFFCEVDVDGISESFGENDGISEVMGMHILFDELRNQCFDISKYS
jgi:hypothetical protein